MDCAFVYDCKVTMIFMISRHSRVATASELATMLIKMIAINSVTHFRCKSRMVNTKYLLYFVSIWSERQIEKGNSKRNFYSQLGQHFNAFGRLMNNSCTGKCKCAHQLISGDMKWSDYLFIYNLKTEFCGVTLLGFRTAIFVWTNYTLVNHTLSQL